MKMAFRIRDKYLKNLAQDEEMVYFVTVLLPVGQPQRRCTYYRCNDSPTRESDYYRRSMEANSVPRVRSNGSFPRGSIVFRGGGGGGGASAEGGRFKRIRMTISCGVETECVTFSFLL